MSVSIAASAASSAASAASAVDLVTAIKPFTPDALANGFATLIGALVGAMLAYALQRRFQKTLEEKAAHTSAHKLMFALLQQVNTIILIQRDYVFERLNDPARFLSIPATPPYDTVKNVLQLPDLAFLIDNTKGRAVLYEFYLAQENYIEALNQWNLRSALHLEQVQPALARARIPNNGVISQEALELKLEAHVFGAIVNSTDNCIVSLQRAFQKLAAAKITARSYLVTRFKSNDFTDFDFPETFGLASASGPAAQQ
jgi:hypothetical protein